MYLNEKAWETEQSDPHKVKEAMKLFLDLYRDLARDFNVTEIYVPENQELYLRSAAYPIAKWMADADIEYRRLYMSFLQRRKTYHIEEEFEVSCGNDVLKGGTEAVLNDSFMISICLDETWKENEISARLYSLADETEVPVIIKNAFFNGQLRGEPFFSILKELQTVKIYSYMDLWEGRHVLFPHLRFSPTVGKDLEGLEVSYLHQIVKKLLELDRYCKQYGGLPFRPELLTKTTVESESTLQKYRKEHTFKDEYDVEYLASWHMRFTGIPGRIFFVPDYSEDTMLVCYIGEKLSNSTYPK